MAPRPFDQGQRGATAPDPTFVVDLQPGILQLRQRLAEVATSSDDITPFKTALLESAVLVAGELPAGGTGAAQAWIEPFLASLNEPYRGKLLAGERPWRVVDPSAVRRRIVAIARFGLAAEGPLLDNPQAAERLANSLLKQFPPEGLTVFTNVTPLEPHGPGKSPGRAQVVATAAGFRLLALPWASQEGFVFVAPPRVTLLWFVGFG
ncbi:MAG: hypothetical protein ACFCBW_01340 [Candidatus Competibacterales bacterium]